MRNSWTSSVESFFRKKAHDLYCSICNQRLNGKTSASVMSHQSDSERCRYIQRNNLKPVKKSFFYWSGSVEIDESMLDLRGYILSVFERYVFTDTETKHQKRLLQCLMWLVYIFRGRLPRERVHRVQHEDENQDEEKLAALFDETYKKRQMRIALINEIWRNALKRTAEKKFCDVSRHGVLSRTNRLRRLLRALNYMEEWNTTRVNEDMRYINGVAEVMRHNTSRNTRPPGMFHLGFECEAHGDNAFSGEHVRSMGARLCLVDRL